MESNYKILYIKQCEEYETTHKRLRKCQIENGTLRELVKEKERDILQLKKNLLKIKHDIEGLI